MFVCNKMHQMTARRARYMQHCRSQRHLKAELRVFWAIAKRGGMATCQPRNTIPICCNESRKVETMVLELGDHESSKCVRGSRTSRLCCVPDASWSTGGTEHAVGVHFIVLVLYLMMEVAQLRNSWRRKSSSVWTRPERHYGVPSDCRVAGWPVSDVTTSVLQGWRGSFETSGPPHPVT